LNSPNARLLRIYVKQSTFFEKNNRRVFRGDFAVNFNPNSSFANTDGNADTFSCSDTEIFSDAEN